MKPAKHRREKLVPRAEQDSRLVSTGPPCQSRRTKTPLSALRARHDSRKFGDEAHAWARNDLNRQPAKVTAKFKKIIGRADHFRPATSLQIAATLASRLFRGATKPRLVSVFRFLARASCCDPPSLLGVNGSFGRKTKKMPALHVLKQLFPERRGAIPLRQSAPQGSGDDIGRQALFAGSIIRAITHQAFVYARMALQHRLDFPEFDIAETLGNLDLMVGTTQKTPDCHPPRQHGGVSGLAQPSAGLERDAAKIV